MNWARRTDGARPIQCRPFGSGLTAANIPTNNVAANYLPLAGGTLIGAFVDSGTASSSLAGALGNECTCYIRPRRTALRRGVRAKPEPRMPALIAPLEVPITQSGSMPASWSAWQTPP
jgi:hypothetical protein